jgi:fructose-1,6-bisphosphatase/inositol monophosphatase family enzyme
MDLAFVIGTIRDVWNRSGIASLNGVFAEHKADGSLMTDIDPLIEEIVLDRLSKDINVGDTAVVREEAEGAAIGVIKNSATLVTIDGIDGTGDFVRHFNHRELNSKWLLAMTAVYERNNLGLYVPKLAFAFQPSEDRLFATVDGEAFQIDQPLGRPVAVRLDARNLSQHPKKGSLDVYLEKAACPHYVLPELVSQNGPSGFNLASLAAACTKRVLDGTNSINFTTFHYNVWDFALWPVLRNAGVITARKTGAGLQQVNELDLNWFGADGNIPGKCENTPLILSGTPDFDPLHLKAAVDAHGHAQ